MTLRETQSLFIQLLGRLIAHAYEMGFELTGGELQRSKEQAQANAASGAGIANSLHLVSLAIDFNLFLDGRYLPNSESHASLGAYWKSLHPLCRWGGDFRPKPDGNHYSLEWEGRK